MSNELALLETVELRLALADTDEKFEKNVATFLAPVILKLDSPNEAVRNKVMSICVHINKRLKSSSGIKVPIEAVLKLFTDPATSALVKNFCLVYLEMGMQRCKIEDLQSYVPQLLARIAERPLNQQTTLFQITLPILAKYTIPTNVSASGKILEPTQDPLGFLQSPKDAKFLLDKILHVVLYTVQPSTPAPGTGGASSDAQARALPAGLSQSDVQFVTSGGKAAFTSAPTELKVLKVSLVKLVANSAVFPESLALETEKYLIYLLAQADANHEVISAGEDAMKRQSKPDFESDHFVARLYELYLGTQQATKGQEANVRAGATVQAKHKILGCLTKSAKATNKFPAVIQVIFDSLYHEKTTARLRNAGMSFVQWVARMATDEVIKPVAPIVLSGLLKFIADPDEGTIAANENENLRGFAYEAIGLISKRAPELFMADATILFNLFKAVSTEQRNVRVSVQEALASMIPAYQNVVSDTEKKLVLEALLLENMDKPEHQARYVAAKYTNALFPFSYPLARYICLQLSSDPKLEVREEARKGLRFPEPPAVAAESDSESSTAAEVVREYRAKLVDFESMCKLLLEKSRKNASTASSGIGGGSSAAIKYVGSLSSETYSNALGFLRNMLILSADPRATLQEFTSSSTNSSIVVERIADYRTRQLYRSFTNDAWRGEKAGGLEAYLELIELALKSEAADSALKAVAAFCLQELVSMCSTSLTKTLVLSTEWLVGYLSALKVETRTSMAHVLGLVATADLGNADAESERRRTELKTLIESLCDTIKDTSKQVTLESRSGSVLALGYIIGRLHYRYREETASILPAELYQRSVETIADELEYASTSANIRITGAAVALGEASRYGPLRIPMQLEGEGSDARAAIAAGSPAVQSPLVATSRKWSQQSIRTKLMNLVKGSNDAKIQEQCVATLGHLVAGNREHSDAVLSFFYTLASSLSKQIEIHFNIGEAICAITCGWASTAMSEYLDVPGATPIQSSDEQNAETLQAVLKHCFKEVQPSASQASKKTVCVWLLCLVKFCGKYPLVKEKLMQIHGAFSSLLGDRDDFVQEVASKGIGLVYELGDSSIKKELVSTLVSTFSEGRRIAPESVTADTQLFDDNTLGTTPVGGSLTTYQSILSLASDMNQPDLVYKFMSLASHNAIWNSRRGASMGFGMIISSAEAELKPYLPQFLPKLYRFQYDPNVKVAESMKSIWSSLVKNPKKEIDEYFDVIVKDLIQGLGDRMWRTREASCRALADVLVGRELHQLEPYLQELWIMCFRALDDIKESVRTAAFATCKALTNITLKYCDPEHVSLKAGAKIMDTVIPFFLTKGLGSMAEDVQKYSLSTVLKICKRGGVLLKPHISEIVGVLLESLSTLEPQAMNYLSFHTDKYNISQEQLDTTRLNAAKMSPMMDAIEVCLEQMDQATIDGFAPKLVQIVRRGVGLPTKAGSARIIVSLTMKHSRELQPHADALLKALSGAILDRSAALRKAYAVALGYTCRICTQPALSRLLDHLRKIYLEDDDEEKRSVAGIAILEVSRTASDALAPLRGEVLPLSYFGSHDASPALKDIWKDIWAENTAGTTGAVKLYQKEMMELCVGLLRESPSWPIKKQVGLMISSMVRQIDAGFSYQMDVAVPLLIEALSGRTWDGKEAVLEALMVASTTCKEWLNAEGKARLSEVTKVMIREAKKNNKSYRRLSVEYLGKFVAGLELNVLDDVYDHLVGVAAMTDADEDMDGEEPRERALILQTRANAFKALGQCWPKDAQTQAKYSKELARLLSKHVDQNVWTVRLGALEALHDYLEAVYIHNPLIFDGTVVDAIADALVASFQDSKYTAVRESTVADLKLLVERIEGTDLLKEPAREKILSGIAQVLQSEPTGAAAETLKEVRSTLSKMQE
ncbi:proteasome stabiliser-domain-containing protein [Polychytrium aggregatum]|uniref:proteasome stabiliser-domain-containing protein n=1 Tax=Polychytrium aggregatum TaxID=110093 RepID=UPI0022FEFE62|nr:proteasome stabiliser-domain-containing protein [Polychytrium aggregatum]KAI9197483.1 proteasome stabiliser-domain-containing protein [Polychytrium aggregatum]